MPVANPSLPTPKNPQTFLVPVWVTVDSDEGGVTPTHLTNHLKAAVKQALEGVADLIDRDPTAPVPFAYHGAAAKFDGAFEIPTYVLALLDSLTRIRDKACQDNEYEQAADARDLMAKAVLAANLSAVTVPERRLLQQALEFLARARPANEDVKILAKKFGLDIR